MPARAPEDPPYPGRTESPDDPLPLDAAAPPSRELETATLGMGCFWGPDARFGAIPGVVRTRVGYAGGDTPRPTYEALGRHVETIRVEYDPARVDFGDLLEVFGAGHDPTGPPRKRQYASVIFWETGEQRGRAERWVRARSERSDGPVPTRLEPLERFWLAEAYHQKYRLRQHRRLVEPLRRRYSGREFVDSTVAARMNGFVAGHGGRAQLESELPLYGLPDRAVQELRRLAGPRDTTPGR